MRKTTMGAVFAAVVVVALTLVVPASAHHNKVDAHGPRCSDIVGDYPDYNDLKTQVRVTMRLADALCSDFTYAFYATPGTPNGAETRSASLKGSEVPPSTNDNEVSLSIDLPAPAAPEQEACVWAETIKPDGEISDRWPDAPGTCEEIPVIELFPPGKSMG